MEKRGFRLLVVFSAVALGLALTLQGCDHLGGTRKKSTGGGGAPGGASSPSGPPGIVIFRADPPSIGQGGETTLEWETYNASSITLSGLGPVSWKGNQKVKPKNQTTYVLTASNATGQTTTKEVTVYVTIPYILSVLAAPEQLSPAPGAVFSNVPRKTSLSWRKVAGAVSYTVEVDCFSCCVANQWCTDVGREYTVTPSVKSTTYKFDFAGAHPGRWRVWGVDKNGRAGMKSDWREFRYTR